MKKILFLAFAVLMSLALLSCKKEKDEVTNTMTLRGETFKIVHAICRDSGDFWDVDLDTSGENNLHGYGGFESKMLGKTTDLKGDFFLSFNPQSGGSICPNIKSGTCKITEVKGGINIIVDSIEEGKDAYKFKMSVFVEDMGENF